MTFNGTATANRVVRVFPSIYARAIEMNRKKTWIRKLPLGILSEDFALQFLRKITVSSKDPNT